MLHAYNVAADSGMFAELDGLRAVDGTVVEEEISRRAAGLVIPVCGVACRRPISAAVAGPVFLRECSRRRAKRNYRGEEKTICFPPPPPGLCQLCFS